MPFDPSILMPHQQVMKDFIVQRPFCAIWLPVGGAKSLTTLAALSEIRPSGHILVIAPKAIARSSWFSEVEKWGFPLRMKSLVVDERDRLLSAAKRKAIYEEFFSAPPTMYFIGKDLLDDLVNSMPTRKYGRQESILWPFPTVIIDESQEFKNPTSVRFKALRKVRPAIVRLIELTGTPAPQSLLDVWSQIYLLDQGLALGQRYTDFRKLYFKEPRIVNGRPAGKWEIHPWAEAVIHERIKHLVLSAENTSVPLPPVTYETVEIELPEHVQSAYRTFKREQVLELATPDPKNPDTLIITADNAAILRGKLLQFASGTLYTGEDHGNDFVQVHEVKLLELEKIVASQPAGDPLLVAYRFQSDQKIIPTYLLARGYQTEVFDGSKAMIDRWNRREIPVMLLQPASFGRGLNIQHGSRDLVWFTLPDSLEQWIQTVGRLRRIGQAGTVRVRSMITKHTVDEKQPSLLSRKKLTQDALLEAVRVEVKDDLALLNNGALAPG
ncbi:DEAD/DEAH box helicase [Arthrobacter bambusae]|nr:DEAD/DEAH box helicase [Arthrobacter bambusae]